MSLGITDKVIAEHLVQGDMVPGEAIGFHIDQTLTPDATSTLVMPEVPDRSRRAEPAGR